MSNEEIAARLAAALLTPSIVLPPRRANIGVNEEQVQLAAELAVHVYRIVLGVLEAPAPTQ